ncbi:CotH kinase family protein, partial [Candidatus Saccharibacteria bacterium]|nr:CotH kinase family protein [Candidatus Saccharibacteria bacterium]
MASIQHASIQSPADTITWKTGQGSGTAEDPYTVTSWQDFVDFIELRRNATKNDGTLKGLYFVQTADIDFPENGTPITPLTGDNGFRGSYDGNGHVIRNIEISYTGSKASGLFGRLYGEIRNLGFEGGTFTVVTSADCAGSLVTNIDGTGYLYNVYSTIDIDATSSGSVFYPGGIAGYASGAMENVYYGGTINVTDIYTGGATIKTFGLARTPDSASSTTSLKIYSSFTLESVANNIDYNFQNRDGTFEFNNEQKNTAPTAFYSAEEIIYRMNLFLLNDRYLNPTKASTFTWTMGGDNAHPVLTGTQTTIEDYLEGNGSAATPYLIDNEADWSFLRLYILANANNQTPATLTGKYFKQTADINFSLNNIEYGSMPFTVKFSGIYDGDGHALTNLKLVGGNGAIFGDVKGTVKNLAIVGGSFQNTDGAYAATIARALSDGGEIINCYSSMSMNNGSTSRTRPLAGIVAVVETTGGTIKNTYYAGSMDTYTCSGNVVAGCTDRYGISYNLNSATLENVYYLSTSADEPYYASTNPTITNVKSVTSEELSGADLLAELNTLAEADQSLKVWELREGAGYEYPVFEGQGIAYGVINSLTVDGDDLQSTADQINWYLDSTSGEYYLFLPNFVDRSSLNLILDNTAGSTVQASLPDTTVLSNDLQSGPTDIFENDQVILKTLVNNAETSSYVVNVMQSTLASVHLTVDGTNAEDPTQSISAEAAFALINGSSNHSVAYPGAMTTYDTSKTKNTVSMKEIKGRGNSSWNKPKKPYQMKFASKLSMFGMTPSKKWLLITNHMDGSLARNFTFFTMAEHLNFEYQIEHTPADLYVNNNYIGSYWVTNKVEVASNSVNIGDEDYLLELDNYKDNSGEDIQVETANGALITIKNPDLEDADAATISAVKADVKQQIEHLETIFADDSLTLADLEEYADMESFAKFYWIQELSANVDAMRGSAYLYYKDGKFHMGPIWDYDYVLNRHYSWSNLQEYFILGNATQRAKTYFEDWYDGLMRKQEFSDLVDKVFLENRDYLVTTLPSEITAYTNLIYSSGKMNEVRWPYSAQGSATYVGSNYEDGVAKLLAAYNKRLAWYDNEYRDLNLAKVQYTYTDLSGTDHVETQNISGDSIAITLPNTTDVAEPVTVVGVLPNDTTRSIRLVSGETSSTGEVTLANRAYTGDLRVENTIGVQIDKTVNANKYSLAITATAPVLTSIEVTTLPTKTTYYEGESFDKTGIVVTAHYDNNVSEAVEDYTVDTAALAANTTEVTVTYNDKTTTVPITMVALESIEVTTQPTKTVYLEGESFDKTGMVVTAHYNDETSATIDNYTVDDSALVSGTTSVTVSYMGKDTTVAITVRALSSIEVTTPPTKTVYLVGEHFDKTGMVVTAHYDNNDTETVEDYTFEDAALAAGTTSVTVSYGGKTTTTPITVRELESIEVTTPPTKTVYNEGEHFDKTGMVVTAHYDNNDTETVEDFTFEDT